MQITRNRTQYDVCIVGSGAGGGMAAKVLTEAGANVIMLEAGVMWDTARDSKMFAWSYDSPRRRAAIPERQFGEFDAGLGKDERSGSATEAGVPEFMDFMMIDQPTRQVAMRGGLAWLDRACEARYDKMFIACSDSERAGVLDQISWPARAVDTPELSHGVAFFSSFRDLTATGSGPARWGCPICSSWATATLRSGTGARTNN